MTQKLSREEARQGRLGVPVALILVASLIAISLAGWFVFAEINY